jgi:plasmid stabilization system protein ParE
VARRISLTFAESAVLDLEDILEYFTEENAVETGRKMVARIIEKTEKLRDYPDVGRVVPEYNMKHLREIIHSPFRIVYVRDRKRVRIVRVWRSERLLKLEDEDN